MEPFQAKLVAAICGSTMTALTMTPFDVVKTRLQTQRPSSQGVASVKVGPTVCCQPANVPCVRGVNNFRHMSSLAFSRSVPEEVVCIWQGSVMHTERVNGFYDAVRHVWRAEGLRGLWKGVGTTIVTAVPSSACYMMTYDYLLREGLPPLVSPSLVPVLAGALARSIVSSTASPLELIRTNLQSTPVSADKPHTLRSVLTSVRGLVRTHGVSHLWRGLGPTLWRDVPFSAVYWAVYERLKQKFARKGKKGASVAFVCGVSSGTFAALLTSPFDVLKSRRQAFVASTASGQVSGMFPLLAQIVRNEGTSALFTGLAPRIAKIAPACGIMIACFEGIGRALTKKDSSQ